MTNSHDADREWSGPMTSDEAFHSCARSDRVLMVFLGETLMQGTIRLVLIFLAVCAVGAALSELVNTA